MSKRTHLCMSLIAALAGLTLSVSTFAQPSGKGDPKSDGSKGGGSSSKAPGSEKKAPQGQPDKPHTPPTDEMKQMEAAMEAAAKPGPMHEWMKGLEGTWQTEIKAFWPGAPEGVQLGVTKRKLELGGRYLMTEYDGRWEGKFFRGLGSMGYNNVENRFEQTWMDTMGTGTMMVTGTADKDGKVLTLTGDFTMPGGMKAKSRQVFTIVSPTRHTEIFYHTVDNNEMKVMEITYTKGAPGSSGDGAKGGSKGTTGEKGGEKSGGGKSGGTGKSGGDSGGGKSGSKGG